MEFYDTVAAISTPPGVGGIAVVRISGPKAFPIVEKLFIPKNTQKKVGKMNGYSASFGEFVWNGHKIDTGVALFFRSPHSYTGEDVIELSCHGGDLVSRKLLEACIEAGAAPAGAGEFTKRAVLNGRMDLSQAEAVLGLIQATGEQGMRQANAALSGVLSKRIEGIREKLTNLAGHLAAWVDYPEEDVEELSAQALAGGIQGSLAELEQLRKSYDAGSLVRRGVQAAIVGSPNVGKSTLFNLFSGFERSIVTPVAGTTRDVVREQIKIGGIVLHVSDTAGLHHSDDLVEAEGIRRSYQELETAGLIFAVFDGSVPTSEADIGLARQCAGKPSIAIVNKEDLGTAFAVEEISPYFSEILQISALQPESLDRVEKSVMRVLKLETFDPDVAAIYTERQLYSINRSIKALTDALHTVEHGLTLDAASTCLDDALAALGELTGKVYSEDIINNVFSNFCVGK